MDLVLSARFARLLPEQCLLLTQRRYSSPTLVSSITMKSNVCLASILTVFAACDASPPLVNELVDTAPEPVTEEWLGDVFFKENPNAAEYRLVNVNNQKILNNADRIRLTLVDGEIVTVIRRSSEVYEGSILWAGVVDGTSDSDVEVRVTSNPYMTGHVVIGDRVELFANAVPGADSIIYRVNTPDRAYSKYADIMPDADPSEIEGVAWRALVDKLPASVYRVVTLNISTWRKKIDELEQTGSTEMRFFDDTRFRVVANERTGYPQIEGDEFSSVSLHYFGGIAGLSGGVRSMKTGAIRVTPIKKTGLYILWLMHPDFRKKID